VSSPLLRCSGLAQAIVGMREGGERHVAVPAYLGKGRTPISGLKSDDDFFLYLRVEKVFTDSGMVNDPH